MRIRITDIPHSGLKIDDSLPLEALNARMQEGRGQDIAFTTAPTVKITVFKTQSGAETKGYATSKLKQECARCSDALEREVRVPLDFTFHHKPDSEVIENEAPDASFTDDIGLIYFEGDHIDLEEVIQEAFILSLSLYWAPECDKADRCTLCHRTRQDFESSEKLGGTTLGSLFKKVGLN